MSLELSEFVQAFYEEASELLEEMEQVLLGFDLSYKDKDKDQINRLFRAIHTIKGNSATFGFNGITEFAHTIETLMGRVRSDKYQLKQADVSLLLKAVDCIKDMIADLQNKLEPNQSSVLELSKHFNKILEIGQEGNVVAQVNTAASKTESVSQTSIKKSEQELVFDLGEAMTFEQVNFFHESFKSALTDTKAYVIFEAAAIREIDTAALQLLVCFIKTGEKQGLRFKWRTISPTLQEYARLLGLKPILG